MIRYFVYLTIITFGLLSAGCNKDAVPAKGGQSKRQSSDVANFDRFYVEGLRNKLMGNGGEALKYFEQCLVINPQSDAVYYQMAQILGATGNISNAKKYALNAVKYDGKNIWYLLLLSQLYYQEKNLDSTIICYEKAVKMFPDNESIQLTLGNLYVEGGDLLKANSIFENFDKKYGVNDASTITSVRILMSTGKYEEAWRKTEELLKQKPEDVVYNGLLAEILSAMGDRDGARKVYDKLFRISPKNSQVQLSYAEFLAGGNDYDELFSVLNTIALNDEVKKEDKIRLFAELIQNSVIVRDKENRLAKSLLVLEASYDNDEIIPLIRADLLLKQGKTDAAIQRLEELVKIRPENYFAWEKLLVTYLEKGDYENLRKRGEECASRFNMSFIAKMLYAHGALETGKYDTALEELRKAEILAAGDSGFMTQVLTLRAEAYYRTKAYNRAFETFEEALKYNKNDLTVMNNYAYYLAEQNMNLKEAEVLARKVIETEKDNNTFLDTYGWVLYKRGKLGDAAKVFENIINSGEAPDAEWYEHYGFILKKQRKCGKAIENWKIAVELDPGKTHLLKEIESCGN